MTIYVNDASGSWADILQISGFEVSALLSQGRPVRCIMGLVGIPGHTARCGYSNGGGGGVVEVVDGELRNCIEARTNFYILHICQKLDRSHRTASYN